MTVAFGTKAETLERLEGRLASAVVLPQVRVTVDDWRRDRQAAVDAVVGQPWAGEAVIVRSSARAEDRVGTSMAGRYRSVPSVAGGDALAAAIDRVVESFDGADDGDQVLVQPMLGDIAFSGVAFGRDPNTGGPYQVIAYDTSGRTAEAVTSGGSSGVETYVRHRRAEDPADPALAPVIRLIEELAAIFGTDALDIEFAVGTDGTVILLQVRPLAIGDDGGAGLDNHADTVASIARKIELMNRPNPYLLGGRAVFGVMPDWNPAEMIGVRPRPLALSLYRELITDSTWAYQRDNYGYRNLRSFPLLVDFHGLPYIDVRVTFNSFIPKDIGHGLAERLADYYLDRLVAAPTLHDKVEFEIIFSCYTLDLADRLGVLAEHGFSEDDCRCLSDSLRTLTNRIIRNEGGLWRRDLDRVHELEARQKAIMASGLDRVSRIYWLLEHAKRYGTLPFAGLARAAFIAVQLLRSLIAVGVLRSDEHDLFMTSLDTVGSRLTRDFRDLSRETFLARYGHLRPGTYDILSARYDEAPDLYFDWSNRGPNGGTANARSFALSIAQLRRIEDLLAEHGLEHSAVGLLEFIKATIEGRELAKFVFTRSVSDALSLFQDLGREFGFSREDCAYADIRVIRDLYIGSGDPAEVVGRSIEAGKRRHALTRSLNLPPLIVDPQDAWAFHVPRFEPNFVTQREAIGPVATDISRGGPLDGGIVLIPSADPGYDWIFSRGIAGFITQYGGVNSHMAIRAGELGIPAVIGAGEALFSEWAAAEMLLVDCANRQVQVLR